VLLVCAERLKPSTQQHLQLNEICTGCVRAIRGHPRVGPNVPIVVAIEGMGAEVVFLGPTFEYCDRDLIVMREFKEDGCLGVPKNERILVGLVGTTKALLMRNLVSVPMDAIAFSSRFAESAPTMRDIRELLAKQFGAFRYDSHVMKITGKGRGGNDDVLIAFMMTLYWMTRFCARNLDVYMQFREKYHPDVWFSALAHNLCMQDEVQRLGESSVTDVMNAGRALAAKT
jgi:hypothetical protein